MSFRINIVHPLQTNYVSITTRTIYVILIIEFKQLLMWKR
jgi:hypothetical protein